MSNAEGGGFYVVPEYLGNWYMVIDHQNSYTHSKDTLDVVLAASTLYHIVYSYDYSENEITVWMSNNSFGDLLDSTTATMSRYAGTNSAELWVGRSQSTYLDGLIDELVIWKGYEINATEAEEIFNGNWR